MPYGKLALDTIETSGGLSVTGNVTSSGSLVATNFDSSNSLGMRNRLINGSITVDQRNQSNTQTITAGAALAYTVDRWYAYCTGANVTGQRVAGTIANTFRYRFTGAASVTAIGFGQRIEAINCADLAGSTATLSIGLSNSLLTTVTWTAFYANTTDTFGTLASPTRTQIATGTFTVNSTFTRYSTNISIPSAATTGIEVVFTVGAQTSGTWVIGDVQLEAGAVAGPVERRPISQELLNCYRYCYTVSGVSSAGDGNAFLIGAGVWNSTSNAYLSGYFPVRMRTIPSLSLTGAANTYGLFTASTNAYTPATGISLTTVTTAAFFLVAASIGSTAGITNSPAYLTTNNGTTQSTNYLIFSAEL
jgi:hypothetical protein